MSNTTLSRDPIVAAASKGIGASLKTLTDKMFGTTPINRPAAGTDTDTTTTAHDLTGTAVEKPICLITGGTEGVGKFTAIELARKGFTVVLASRNESKAEKVKREIASITGNTDADYIVADLASLDQVRRLAETFKQRYPRLDVLINNAGVLMPSRQVTVDGFELSYQVNYLSHFLLTLLLLDELKRSEQGRIINLSSSVHSFGQFDPENVQSEKRFSVMGAYSASKLYMLLFTIELAKRLRGTRVTVNAVHPGIVRTQMMFQAPGVFKILSYLSLPFSVSSQKGAETSVYLASSRDVQQVSGKYFAGRRETEFKTKFNTEHVRELLWNATLKNALVPDWAVLRPDALGRLNEPAVEPSGPDGVNVA